MKRLFLILLVALVTNCDQCDPSTDESGEKPYAGNPNAVEPYSENPEWTTRQISCGGAYCTYTVIATVLIHNPTDTPVVAVVVCNYLVGDYLAATNAREDIGLQSRSETTGTKEVVIEHFVDLEVEQASSVSVSCEADFE
jgi:hypothetical protein